LIEQRQVTHFSSSKLAAGDPKAHLAHQNLTKTIETSNDTATADRIASLVNDNRELSMRIDAL
jgi:hypothetical protein